MSHARNAGESGVDPTSMNAIGCGKACKVLQTSSLGCMLTHCRTISSVNHLVSIPFIFFIFRVGCVMREIKITLTTSGPEVCALGSPLAPSKCPDPIQLRAQTRSDLAGGAILLGSTKTILAVRDWVATQIPCRGGINYANCRDHSRAAAA